MLRFQNKIKRYTLAILLIIPATYNSHAQLIAFGSILRDSSAAYLKDTIPKWPKKTELSANMTQTSYTNWANGGSNSFSISGLVNSYRNYTNKHVCWDNSLDLAYGLQYQDSRFAKTDDKIDFASKYGQLITNQWYAAAFVNFKTQFSAGFSDGDRVSNCLSPGYIIMAMGVDYKPDKDLTLFISPATDKITMVIDDKVDPSTYGINNGHRLRNELGAYLRAKYHQMLFENTVELTTKVELFSDYLHNPQNMDMNWENLIKFKVNKYISSTISTQLMYDDDTKTSEEDASGETIERGARIQFKEIIGVGFSYTL
jgi:hypothetical protein